MPEDEVVDPQDVVAVSEILVGVGCVMVDIDRRGEGDEFVSMFRREGGGVGDRAPVDGVSIGEPSVLLERSGTLQGFQDAAGDEGVDRFDEFVVSGWIGEQVDPALFEGALDLGEMDALVFVLEHDGSDQPIHDSIRDYMWDVI